MLFFLLKIQPCRCFNKILHFNSPLILFTKQNTEVLKDQTKIRPKYFVDINNCPILMKCNVYQNVSTR